MNSLGPGQLPNTPVYSTKGPETGCNCKPAIELTRNGCNMDIGFALPFSERICRDGVTRCGVNNGCDYHVDFGATDEYLSCL